MKHLFSLLLLACPCAYAITVAHQDQDTSPSEIVRLYARSKHGSHEKCTFSFEFGLRDDPENQVTRGDWDLQFDRGWPTFNVTMINDDRSRILDLGSSRWSEMDLSRLPTLEPFHSPQQEAEVPVVKGHMYLVLTRDRDTNLLALFRVEEYEPEDWVDITWKVLKAKDAHIPWYLSK